MGLQRIGGAPFAEEHGVRVRVRVRGRVRVRVSSPFAEEHEVIIKLVEVVRAWLGLGLGLG